MTASTYRRLVLLACISLMLPLLWGCGRKSQKADTQEPPPLVAGLPGDEVSPQPGAETDAAGPAARPPGGSAAEGADEPETTEPSLEPNKAEPPPEKPASEKPAPKPEPKRLVAEEPPAPPPAPSVPEVPAGIEDEEPKGTTVVGKIKLVSNVPDPSTVTYKDCVTFIKYQVEDVESGDYSGDELIAVFWGMRNSKLQPAAKFSPGQRHRLTIQPLSERADLQRVMQADDTNDYSLTPYWVVSYSAK